MSPVQLWSEAPFAGIAHLAERHLAKVEVASSNLVARSIRRHSQEVRQRTANPRFSSPNLDGASTGYEPGSLDFSMVSGIFHAQFQLRIMPDICVILSYRASRYKMIAKKQANLGANFKILQKTRRHGPRCLHRRPRVSRAGLISAASAGRHGSLSINRLYTKPTACNSMSPVLAASFFSPDRCEANRRQKNRAAPISVLLGGELPTLMEPEQALP